MAASLQEILDPIVLTQVISQQMAAERWILQFMGFEPGGFNTANFGHGRTGSYQIFNNTRKSGKLRAPGTAAARSSRQSVGVVPFVYPRMHDSIGLLAEEIHNIAQIGDPRMRDIAGANYIQRQTRYLAQKAANHRALMTVGMLRDSLYVIEDGDDWRLSLTSTSNLFQINFNMPAGNKSQLDMLGAGDIITTSWDNPAADIPLHLSNIDAAFQELYGGRLENIICPGNVWQQVIKNDHVSSQAGIANAPFRRFERVVGTREDGSPINASVGEIAARPGLLWYITDEGLEIGAEGSEAFVKYVADNNAMFLPDVRSTGIFSMMEGSEPIAEVDGGPETVKTGFAAWSTKESNPTVTNLFALDNVLPVNHIPNSNAYGTVIF